MSSKKQTMDESEYLMSSPAMAEVIRQGQEDMMNRKGRVITLDEILREGDKEIAVGKFTPIAIEDLWK